MTVLILFRNSDGKFLLERASTYYPEGIARLLGGGINPGEQPIDAAIREMKEETGISIRKNDFLELVQVNVEGIYKSKIFKSKVFVYYLYSKIDEIISGSVASDISTYSESDYRIVVDNFLKLRDDNLCSQKENTFSWGDYGKVYGFIQKVALEEFLRRKL